MTIAAADALMGVFGLKRVKVIKVKHCKCCGNDFFPSFPLQKGCSFDCELKLGLAAAAKSKAKREKVEKAADRKKRESLKSRAQWLKEAQDAFNAWTRKADEGQPCISCGRMHDGQWHAGHYLSVGARPELRFEPDNCWRQCQPCNTHLHGNLILYRVNLIKKIGVEAVEWLEGPHEPKHYSIEDLRGIKARYVRMLKLSKEVEHG